MYSVIYVGDAEIFKVGPFASEDEAMKWVAENRFTGAADQLEYEFDLNDQHVYLIGPDHSMTELNESDFE